MIRAARSCSARTQSTRMRSFRTRTFETVRARLTDESGNAIIEFVFVAVLVMVPLIYLIVSVAVVQRAQLAVTNGAREAGRAFGTADNVSQGLARAQVAVRLVFEDAGIPEAPTVRFVRAGAGCTDAAVEPTLAAGSEFTVCVRRTTALPAIPSILQGRGIVNEGRFILHIDDYRSA
ncbi:MAG: hypothetical protein JWM76_2515 [Pseudonocardiales bacterium]|nr:hypothetical protein [Pseudonocardiales bacterium]